MNILHVLVTVTVLALLALLLKPLSERLQFPYPALLVAAGFVGSELLVAVGIDTGLRWHNFREVVYYLLLPPLIYEIAFRLSAEQLFKNLLAVLLLSMPLMLIAVFIAATILFVGIGHVEGFPFVAALIAAALLSMNDPAAVSAVLGKINLSQRLDALLRGESLFNTIVALVLVSLAVNIEVMGQQQERSLSFLSGFILFVKLFSGGVLAGLACGLIGWLLLHYARFDGLRLLLTIVIAYATFLLAETYLQVSGIIAVLTAGLLLNAYSQRAAEVTKVTLQRQWNHYAAVAGVALFLLLGVSVYWPLLQQQWIAVLLGIVALLMARGLIIYVGFWLLGRLSTRNEISNHEKVALVWGGLKGAISAALLFTLPDLDYISTVHAIVYGVVLFSLFVQAPTLRWFSDKSKP